MKINILGILKGAAELVVSSSVGVVIGNVVKATTPYELNRLQKISVAIGGAALGGVLGDLSAKHVGSQIDAFAVRIENLMHPSEEVAEAVDNAKEAVVDVVDAVVTDIQKPSKKDSPSEIDG